MSNFEYTYSEVQDFPQGKIYIPRFIDEVQSSSIVTALDYVSKDGDNVRIFFKEELSTTDKTTLDGDVINPASGLIGIHNSAKISDIQTVKIDNSNLGYMTRSVDRGSLLELEDRNEECVALSIRLKPNSNGIIVPCHFGAMVTSEKHAIARLYCNATPSAGSGLWENYGKHSQVIKNPMMTPPASGLQISTIFIGQKSRASSVPIEGLYLTDESKSFYITLESYSNEVDATVFITWKEKDA